LWNGIYQHITGVYSDTFTSIKGCDSIAKLYLTVLPLYASNFNITICQGQTYLWNGVLRNTSGNYSDTFTSIQGCDSIVTLNLNVTPKPKVVINKCFSSSGGYTFFGRFLTAAGIYLDSTSLGNTCDTVCELHLEKIDTIYNVKDTFSCNSMFFNGTNYTQNDSLSMIIYSYQGCDSVISKYYIHISHIIPKPILQTHYFCDTFLYKGKSYAANKKFYDTFHTNVKPFCDSIYNTYSYLKYPKPNIWLNDTQHLSLIRGNSISVEVNGANRYEWSTGETNSKINLSPTHNQVYYVKGWNEYCLDSISFKLTVFSDKCRIEFPTAFTPNGDGNNDIYIGRPFEGSKIIEFKVFNRLGQLLFFSTDENFGWDGYYKGELQNSEPYYYTYIATSCVPGKYQTGDGNFMLLR